MKRAFRFFVVAILTVAPIAAAVPPERLESLVEEKAGHAVSWRHHLHRNPELSNRETATAAFVAERLRELGLEVETGIAHTGVVGVLRGELPGPIVAVRADIDALPVTEASGLPFASTARTEYQGQDVGVSHACGHDVHTAVALGLASSRPGRPCPARCSSCSSRRRKDRRPARPGARDS